MKDRKKKQRSILVRIFVPMLLFLLLQTGAIWGVVFGTNVVGEVENNAFETFNGRAETRMTYLQNDMSLRWGNIENTVTVLRDEMQALLTEEGLTPDALPQRPDVRRSQDVTFADAYFSRQKVYEGLVSVIRSNSVTGAFIAYLPDGKITENVDGLYLRCETPQSVEWRSTAITIASDYMSNFLLDHRVGTTDKGPGMQFELTENDANDAFFFKPYNAYRDDSALTDGQWEDYDYWAPPHDVVKDGTKIISYSVPLVVDDYLYGVFGVDLSVSYLAKSLPYYEISGGKDGAYILARPDGEDGYRAMVHTGTDYTYLFGTDDLLQTRETRYGNEYNLMTTGTQSADDAFLYRGQLKMYDNSSYFKNERWYFMGLLPEDVILQFSRKITTILIVSFLAGDMVGVLLLVFIAMHIASPVSRLPQKIETLGASPTATLDRTGIREIDALITSIENLSQSVMDNAAKMSKIIELSGVPLGAFEVDLATHKVTFAGKIAELTDRADFVNGTATADAFLNYLQELEHSRVEEEDNARLYAFVDGNGAPRWITVRTIDSDDRVFGIVQDVTEDRIDRNRIEYERDYDVLTSLLNRRAFLSRAQKLAEEPSHMGLAALILLDMDNLKVLNDTFGHEQGDEYLRSMAKTLKAFIAGGEELISRLSGDEFVVFLYGYDDIETLRDDIRALRAFITETNIIMPTNQKLKLRCSAGVAYYPQDATRIDDLLLYADYAMYEIKQTTRGEFNDFKRETYNNREYRSSSYESLNTLIEKNLVTYEYQPIVSLKTGEIFGYEALMRSLEPTLGSPQEVLSMARAQHKQHYIERMTWFNALEGYSKFTGKAANRCVFINSIPSQMLAEEDIAALETRYGDALRHTVIEFTEDEKLNEEFAREKKKVLKKWGGKIALDDFGTGYSTDTVLLILNPDFIKVDMFIVRDIDKNPNKRKLLENIVSYAAEHKIKVIAEGVETRAELETVVRYNVDYVQGFYVSRPMQGGGEIKSEKRKEIRELYRTVQGERTDNT